MWINESVICASYTYKWGVALPVWWASGLSFQIALMALLGIVAKLRVPYAHTSLEFMRIRYGKYAHWIFILLNLVNNIFGCGSMILAGAQLVTGMTGMHVVAACILIPAGGKYSRRHCWRQKLSIDQSLSTRPLVVSKRHSSQIISIPRSL
jgi:hypothetical protein